jgi:hypothetical protein
LCVNAPWVPKNAEWQDKLVFTLKHLYLWFYTDVIKVGLKQSRATVSNVEAWKSKEWLLSTVALWTKLLFSCGIWLGPGDKFYFWLF